jgi:hypothetical protein
VVQALDPRERESHATQDGSIGLAGSRDREKRAKTGLVFRRELLLKGKSQYALPPCTERYKSADFNIANITYFLTKQIANLMRR